MTIEPIGAHSELDAHDDRRSLLLFGLVSVTYAVVIKDVFLSIYTTLISLNTQRSTLPTDLNNVEALFSKKALATMHVSLDHASIALILLLIWGAYLWIVVGARYSSKGTYSPFLLAADMVFALVLYVVAASLGHRQEDAEMIPSVPWLGMFMLSLLLQARLVYFVLSAWIPFQPVPARSVVRWITESTFIGHLNALLAMACVTGWGMVGAINDGWLAKYWVSLGAAVAILWLACMAFSFGWRRDRSRGVRQALWNEALARKYYAFYIPVIVYMLLAFWLLMERGRTGIWLSGWATRIPFAFVALAVCVVAAVIWGGFGLLQYETSRRSVPQGYEGCLEKFNRTELTDGLRACIVEKRRGGGVVEIGTPESTPSVAFDILERMGWNQSESAECTIGVMKKRRRVTTMRALCRTFDEDRHGDPVSVACIYALDSSRTGVIDFKTQVGKLSTLCLLLTFAKSTGSTAEETVLAMAVEGHHKQGTET